ncbi:reverse transcriptase [Abeliophyllum distichum]|uniref:Reverse transcriptase n=1 Tax=Abeliophyllum distichum TaxID=126358 RepID=A0ABD1SZ27_9LAMI
MATSGGELMSNNATEIWSFFQKQADNSQQRSRSSRTEPMKRGIYEIRSNELSSEIKEVKCMIEHISRKLTSLTANNSIEPDACTDQANALNMMRKPPYNPYSNTYNLGWRDHPNFSWSQGGQQDNTASQAPRQTTGQFNQNIAQSKPWEEAIQKLTKVTQAALEHQNHTITEFKNEVRASQNLQA